MSLRDAKELATVPEQESSGLRTTSLTGKQNCLLMKRVMTQIKAKSRELGVYELQGSFYSLGAE